MREERIFVLARDAADEIGYNKENDGTPDEREKRRKIIKDVIRTALGEDLKQLDEVSATVDEAVEHNDSLNTQLETAMRQNRKQDTALRLMRKCAPDEWQEFLDSALTVDDELLLNGERINVDELINSAFPQLRW